MFILLFAFGSLFVFLMGSSAIRLFGEGPVRMAKSKPSILKLELNGVIMDGRRLLKPLRKYREEKHIKAVVVEVNSPGGVVGPSQEIYEELRRTSKMGKPVVVVSNGVMASGAFYAAMGADHVLVAPGTMVGSIGVIVEFTNLEKLYDWAKIKRYSITTGKYKDSGAEYRTMRPDERDLFQEMIDDVHMQFKKTVAESRKLPLEEVTKWSDGRVFTGERALAIKFVDGVGTSEDGYLKAAELAKLGSDYEVFSVPKRRPGLLELIGGSDDDQDWSTEERAGMEASLRRLEEKLLNTSLNNRLLYLMPGTW